MIKLFFGTFFVVLVIAIPILAMAGVDSHVGSPPPVLFPARPELIVIPETNVYFVSDVHGDIFFYNGWWWRPWGGHWYRSRHYSSGWVDYQIIPSFYVGILSDWREYFSYPYWRGHQWNYQRIPYQPLEWNWSSWGKGRYWEERQMCSVQVGRPDWALKRSLEISIWQW